MSWRHSGFSVHAGVRVEEKAAAARLGRYMARCPIVLDRLEWDADREEVVVHPRPSRRGGPFGEPERLDVLEFLARVLDHVPEPRRQQVRYWGWYSMRLGASAGRPRWGPKVVRTQRHRRIAMGLCVGTAICPGLG